VAIKKLLRIHLLAYSREESVALFHCEFVITGIRQDEVDKAGVQKALGMVLGDPTQYTFQCEVGLWEVAG
jgi:hypothetical protein